MYYRHMYKFIKVYEFKSKISFQFSAAISSSLPAESRVVDRHMPGTQQSGICALNGDLGKFPECFQANFSEDGSF